MPWKITDVEKHRKGLDAKGKRQWVQVANSALKKCMDDGGDEESCAASAIRQANGVVGRQENEDMENYRLLSTTYDIREELHQGRKHLVIPVIMMKEGVHRGSHGPLLHRSEDLGLFPGSWNGIPVCVHHPQEDGTNVSANHPHIIDEWTIGRVFNTVMDNGSLKAEAWLDKDSLSRFPEVLEHITQGKPLDVSVGVFTEDEMVAGDWQGEAYEGIARNHRPDHLALLPGGIGACSWDDGCGVRAYAWSDEARAAAAEARRGHSRGPKPADRMSMSGKASTTAETASNFANETGTAAAHAIAAREHGNAAILYDRDGNAEQADWHREQARIHKDKARQLKQHQEGDNMQTNVGRLKYDGTEATAWSAPTLADFGMEGKWQDLSQSDRAKVAAHYLIGTGSTESFADLKLPVVNPKTGKLNEHALRACIGGRGSQLQAPPKEKMAAMKMAYRLLNDEFGADLETPNTLALVRELTDQWSKDLAVDGVCLQANVMSFQDISSKIQTKLDNMDDDTKVHYLEQCFDGYFIYRIRPKVRGDSISPSSSDGEAMYKRTYRVNSDESIEFTGEAQPVVKKTEYVTQSKGENNMKKPCCPERVELLIQNEQNSWAEADREFLLAMTEDQLAKLETNVSADVQAKAEEMMAKAKKMMEDAKKMMGTNEAQVDTKAVAIQVLKEELADPVKVLALLPPETRATLEHGQRLYQQEKERKIAHILANTVEGVYTKEKLEALGDDVINDLAAGLKAPVAYDLAGGHVPQANAGFEDEGVYPPGVN